MMPRMAQIISKLIRISDNFSRIGVLLLFMVSDLYYYWFEVIIGLTRRSRLLLRSLPKLEMYHAASFLESTFSRKMGSIIPYKQYAMQHLEFLIQKYV